MEIKEIEEKVEKLIVSGMFEDLLVLAENFWEYPQKTRLSILARTSVNPFVVRNNFVALFRAFGFTTYFEKYALRHRRTGDILDDASREKQWNDMMEKEQEKLIEKMNGELREIVCAPRLCSSEIEYGHVWRPSLPELKNSFCDNVLHGVFVSPTDLPGFPDYGIVLSSVRQLAMRLKYPEIDNFFSDRAK